MSSLCKIPGPGFSNLPLQLLQRSPFWPSSITLRPPHFYSAAKISSLSLCSDHVTPLHDVPPLAPRALLDPEQTPCSPSKATMALSSPLASCHLSAHGLQSSSPTTLYDLTSPVLLKRVRPFLWLPPPPPHAWQASSKSYLNLHLFWVAWHWNTDLLVAPDLFDYIFFPFDLCLPSFPLPLKVSLCRSLHYKLLVTGYCIMWYPLLYHARRWRYINILLLIMRLRP